jgi:tRNA (guanine-N7-)-methyltransferase
MIPLSRSTVINKPDNYPIKWHQEFNRRAAIQVDLGCGRGHFALARAEQSPNTDFVALDWKKKWIDKINQTANQQGVSNLIALQCDITQDLSILFDIQSIDGLTILHPDPWWKKKHRKRRLVQPEFTLLLTRLLRPGGWVYIQTDVDDLSYEISSVFEENSLFESTDPLKLHADKIMHTRSHREKKCLELGIPVFRHAYLLSDRKTKP